MPTGTRMRKNRCQNLVALSLNAAKKYKCQIYICIPPPNMDVRLTTYSRKGPILGGIWPLEQTQQFWWCIYIPWISIISPMTVFYTEQHLSSIRVKIFYSFVRSLGPCSFLQSRSMLNGPWLLSGILASLLSFLNRAPIPQIGKNYSNLGLGVGEVRVVRSRVVVELRPWVAEVRPRVGQVVLWGVEARVRDVRLQRPGVGGRGVMSGVSGGVWPRVGGTHEGRFLAGVGGGGCHSLRSQVCGDGGWVQARVGRNWGRIRPRVGWAWCIRPRVGGGGRGQFWPRVGGGGSQLWPRIGRGGQFWPRVGWYRRVWPWKVGVGGIRPRVGGYCRLWPRVGWDGRLRSGVRWVDGVRPGVSGSGGLRPWVGAGIGLDSLPLLYAVAAVPVTAKQEKEKIAKF